jgi:uncharacterized protein
MKKVCISLLVFICSAISASFAADIPYLTGRVNDNAQILSEETRKSLTEVLKQHEERTTNQVVILTIPSLEGENIEDYSNKVFNEWKLGQKEKNNGILIVVVPGERKMRIEVGYGLESTLPDISAGQIIRNIMTPKFKQGDYNGGITDGTQAVVSILDGKQIPELAAASTNETETSSAESGNSGLDAPDMPITTRILIGAFIFGIIGLFTFIGIVTPGVGWFLFVFLIPFWAMFPIMVVGSKGALIILIIYLVLYPSVKLYLGKKEWYKKAKHDLHTKGRASIGGFVMTSGGSGGSWSSGGSSGGFSGGGGSSGGGGASGSW